MKTIETDIHISEDKTIQLTLPEVSELQPGMYHVIVVIDDNPVQSPDNTSVTHKEPLKFNVFKWEGWPADCTFRREDIYEDDAR